MENDEMILETMGLGENFTRMVSRYADNTLCLLLEYTVLSDAERVTDTFAEILKREGNVPFHGSVSNIKFHFEYCKPAETFAEPAILADELAYHAGYRSKYDGVISVELSSWGGHENEAYFETFIAFLADYNCPIVFLISCETAPHLKKIRESLTQYFRVAEFALNVPSKEFIAAYIQNYLDANGVDLPRTGSFLCAFAERMQSNWRGIMPMDLLCRVFADFIKQAEPGGRSSEQLIDDFMERSGFLIKNRNNKRVGFGLLGDR